MNRISDIFAVSVILFSMVILVSWIGFETGEDYSGPIEKEYYGIARVVDGDTLIINRNKIRLEGIDAPEMDQMCFLDQVSYWCGKKSQRYLQTLLKQMPAQCKAWRRDRYGRLLGRCFIGETDVNARMVHEGWAVSFGDYYQQENYARRKKNGMWAGKFDYPKDWRKSQRNNLNIVR